MNEIILNPPKSDWYSLCRRPELDRSKLDVTVVEIINQVKQKGDQAIRNYAKEFQNINLENVWVTKKEIRSASQNIDKKLKSSILLAKRNIEKFHKTQIERVKKTETSNGVVCWRKSIPVQNVGLYIPGGSAPLFSTLLMLGIPAKIAGCSNIVVSTPTDASGNIHPAILYVAGLLQIDKIYKSGGAQAIAAMAYGTETMQKADKIFGPGNQYVTAAKKFIQSDGITIDMLAGPSEVAVYADETSIPSYIAADLLSQAEHGSDSQVVLVATNKQIIQNVISELNIQIPLLQRKNIIEQSLSNARMLVMKNPDVAFDFINTYAPEHLIIASDKAEKLAEKVINAGSVFLGNFSPESAGDYASGTNHSLPTNGWARTHSGVSVDSFVKKITFQKLSRNGLKNIGNAVETMAEAEGLAAHKNAVSIRLKK